CSAAIRKREELTSTSRGFLCAGKEVGERNSHRTAFEEKLFTISAVVVLISSVPTKFFLKERTDIRRMKTTAISMRSARWLVVSATCAAQAFAAETLLQEGFNTDGTTSGRYTMTGRDVYEVTRIQSELNNFDQKGPIYFEHNFNVSFVGIPPIPDR